MRRGGFRPPFNFRKIRGGYARTYKTRDAALKAWKRIQALGYIVAMFERDGQFELVVSPVKES